MKYSIVIPAHNEESCIQATIDLLVEKLSSEKFDYEIIVVCDHCTDSTKSIVEECGKGNPSIRAISNLESAGFGMAVRCGLEHFSGDAVAIFMGDAS
ncbi:MAG: glycosyltransferase family 2 protein, partial [Lentisphaeria bacterium]|nr:glycosyltransferase family 2 protein [Lentisphaeria bacterium]